MASPPSFRRFVEQRWGKFAHFVVYAVLEWLMIILLFIDGFLAFLANEYAKFFELKTPCLLCNRIDHLLMCRNPNFYYNDAICEAHKRDVSSLAYCHVHRKLSDLRSMCEGCLLSYATEKESDSDASKSLAGIMDADHRINNFKSLAGRRDDVVPVEKINGSERCSCCAEPLKGRPTSKGNALNSNSPANPSLLSQAPLPSPRAPPMAFKSEELRNLELPHARFMEVKFMTDNEHDLPEDEYSQSCKEDNKAASLPLLPEPEDITEEVKTPSFFKGNKFFGIPLTDSAAASPRFSRIPKKLQLERSELLSESNDPNEADGDSILQRLKRQVRLDRKSLIELYMELDEERSAAAVAANNAMAMITRLQAEKASVQMEALQYQRMMEEQAEYDQEALQVLKEMLLKREEDVKVLEAELDTYRLKFGPVNNVDSVARGVDVDEDFQDLKSQSFSSRSERSDYGSPSGWNHSGENEGNSRRHGRGESREWAFEESPLDFEGERSYLLGLLANLEKNVNPSSEDDGIISSESDMAKREAEHAEHENKTILAREVSLLKERLRAIEADSGFLKHAAMTLQQGGEGTKLLTEIALHLRKLRQSVKTPPEDIDA